MQTPGYLWLYLVIAFGCLVLLTVALRVNFNFIKNVQASCQCSTRVPNKQRPRFKATRIWGYIGLGSLLTLLILIFVALITEVTDVHPRDHNSKNISKQINNKDI